MKRLLLIIATFLIFQSAFCSPSKLDFKDYTDLIMQLQFLSAKSKAKALDTDSEIPYYTWLADFFGNAGQSPEIDGLRYLVIQTDETEKHEALKQLTTGVFLLFNEELVSEAFVSLNKAIELADKEQQSHLLKLSYFAILELYKREIVQVSDAYGKYVEKYREITSTAYDTAWYHLHRFNYITKKVDVVRAREELPLVDRQMEDFFMNNVLNERIMTAYFYNKAIFHSDSKEWALAADYFQRTIDFGKTEDFLRDYVFHANLHLAECYSSLLIFDKALPVLEQAMTFWDKSDTVRSQYLQNLFAALYYFEKVGEYDSAYALMKQTMELDRQLRFQSNSLRLTELKVDLDVAEIENQNLLKDRELEDQGNLLTIGTIILVFFIAFIIILYIANRKISNQNEKLKLAYEEISLKNTKIETLMKELHHRVKNNLQIISSLLGLQSMKLKDESAKKAVSEGKERIRAMSLIHQRLYQNELVTSLNIRDYISDLIEDISKSYRPNGSVKLDIQVPSIEMDADTAMPIGLIINELVTNSFKYAFSEENRHPQLSLSLYKSDENIYKLTVKDNGRGIPHHVQEGQQSTFGMKLVTLLVNKQLKGKIHTQNDGGLMYSIQFPVIKLFTDGHNKSNDR
ncbi:MAG: sensor histidine kinase [Cyclobacteriaceae bacterium]